MTSAPRTPAAVAGLALACAGALALTGCGDGVTVAGRPTSLATATGIPPAAAPTAKLRTPTPSPTPTEERRTAPGPEIRYRTPQGEGLLRVVTYSWQRTKFGENSVPPSQRYLVLDVEIIATTGVVEVLPLNIKAVVPGGATVDPTFGRDGNEPTLAHQTLQAGQTLRGFVVFDVEQRDVVLTVLDELGAKAGEAKIPGV
ncbi:hypothetical protein [Mariniluteicoccus flavus]